MNAKLLAAVVCAIGLTVNARGSDDFRTLSVPWSHSSPTTIGSGIDVDLINQQRFSCLNFVDTDLKWLDSDGAVSTSASIELVSDYKSLARTLGLEVDYKSKADVSIAALKAGGSLDLHLKYDSFAKDESRTAAIVIKAASDYGRRGLRNYPLKADLAELITEGKFDEFRQRCGTHTVVAEHRDALVAIVITLSDITSSSKQAFEGMYKTSVSGSGTINAATVSGNADFSTRWNSLIEAAARMGTLKVSFESRGGAGISDATKLAITSDPTKIDQILAAISTIGASFTKENSAPVEYLLISNTAFGVKNKLSDTSKLDALNTYYLRLSRLDYALDKIDGYKSSFPDIYKNYYSKYLISLRSQRTELVNGIEACAIYDKCDYVMPAELSALFADDIVTADTVKLDCSYKRYDTADHKVKLNVLTNAAVVVRGRARLTEYVSLPTAILSRFGPEPNAPMQMVTAFQAFAMSAVGADGTSRIVAQVDNVIFTPDVSIATGTITINNLSEMTIQRQNLLASVYGIGIQAKNGMFTQNTVGPPYGGDCPLQSSAL
ncbi:MULTISPECIES: hypothetical protein [Paraburkholderia]|uniref:hypothetical protein n=1 Tax=Paraburkholderia TaxID=1822464 RepID=UPI00225A2A72|nr:MULTISPECIES: hypothetical protein [Paraburkholderia]MCX4175641.1 hypothetical protein [Paraburkholderia madseniana]MDQ6463636.1 hypothetical protein [Paraburkholderia madseniana]